MSKSKDLGVQILGENVIIELKIDQPKKEEITAGGIVIPMAEQQKVDEQQKIPTYGIVVQVGPGVPEHIAVQLLNKRVALPSGNFHRMPHLDNPDISDEEFLKTTERHVWANYKSLFLVFND